MRAGSPNARSVRAAQFLSQACVGLPDNRLQRPPDIVGDNPLALFVRMNPIGLVERVEPRDLVQQKRYKLEILLGRDFAISSSEALGITGPEVRRRLHHCEKNPRTGLERFD